MGSPGHAIDLLALMTSLSLLNDKTWVSSMATLIYDIALTKVSLSLILLGILGVVYKQGRHHHRAQDR
jgi:hypothetical protein